MLGGCLQVRGGYIYFGCRKRRTGTVTEPNRTGATMIFARGNHFLARASSSHQLSGYYLRDWSESVNPIGVSCEPFAREFSE